MKTIERPGADEYAESFAGYVAGIGDEEDVVTVLVDQLDELLGHLGGVSEAREGYRYAPGKWSIKEVIGHLSDTERVFAYRALRVARGDQTPLPGFDDQAYVPEVRADEHTLGDLVAEWGDVRRATVALFRNLPAGAWERRGTASDRPISARALAYVIAGHTRHHLEVLRGRYLE